MRAILIVLITASLSLGAEKDDSVAALVKTFDGVSASSWNGRAVSERTSVAATDLLKSFQKSFVASDRDCRLPAQGPMVSLSPSRVITFALLQENISIELYEFSVSHKVLQIVTTKQKKRYFQSQSPELVEAFASLNELK